MPKIVYEDVSFSEWRIKLIVQALSIINAYQKQGYELTLRQLYYQFVARDLFPDRWKDKITGSTNNVGSYQKLGVLIGEARMSGLIDWNSLIDRTRELSSNSHWDNPESIIKACSNSYAIDKWERQKYRPEVWVEKDALEGVVGKVCRELDISYFSCRGYTSLTSIWQAGQRLKNFDEIPVVIHLGDHDPSGIDMSRDIDSRVKLFMDGKGHRLIFKRIALNINQVRQYNPPENPAKVTDSRYKKYEEEFGDSSWELDALDPTVINDIIYDEISNYRDDVIFTARQEKENIEKDILEKISTNYNNIVSKL